VTVSICRKVLQQVLFLYPKPFREEFGKEILETFQECEQSQHSWPLLMDILQSALMQRIRSLRLPHVTTGVALGAVLIACLWTPAEQKPPQHISYQKDPLTLQETYYLYSSIVTKLYARRQK